MNRSIFASNVCWKQTHHWVEMLWRAVIMNRRRRIDAGHFCWLSIRARLSAGVVIFIATIWFLCRLITQTVRISALNRAVENFQKTATDPIEIHSNGSHIHNDHLISLYPYTFQQLPAENNAIMPTKWTQFKIFPNQMCARKSSFCLLFYRLCQRRYFRWRRLLFYWGQIIWPVFFHLAFVHIHNAKTPNAI